MSWRRVQLNHQPCKQDRLILDLFDQHSVRYVGGDSEFAEQLTIDNSSSNLILIVNEKFWLSELVDIIKTNFVVPTHCFYIGINRYGLLGNDTDITVAVTESPGEDLIEIVKNLVTKLGYAVEQTGSFDLDRGRHFNFVQPLTWLYGKTANTSN